MKNEIIKDIHREMEIDFVDLRINPFVENIVKSHLDIIILFMLSKGPMCGYDVIKEIFAAYNVLLSQGTVYPLLYSLKEEGIVRAEYEKGNMRTKMYQVTEDGKQIIEKRIDEFVEAETYVFNSVREGRLNV